MYAIRSYYEVNNTVLHHYIDANFTLLKLGEEALVPLPEFDLQGPRRARLRQSRNRAQREGLVITSYSIHYTKLYEVRSGFARQR